MIVNASDYLDHHNQALWDELSSDYAITISTTTKDYCEIDIRDKVVEIRVVTGPACKDSFVYELLHLHLDQMKIKVGPLLQLLSSETPRLSPIFPETL